MDFEANKEQRPLQISDNKKSGPDFSISSASHASSLPNLPPHTNQMSALSDPYVNTNV